MKVGKGGLLIVTGTVLAIFIVLMILLIIYLT